MVLSTLTTTPYAGIIRIRFATIVAGSGKHPFQSQPTFASAPPVVFFNLQVKNTSTISFCQENYQQWLCKLSIISSSNAHIRVECAKSCQVLYKTDKVVLIDNKKSSTEMVLLFLWRAERDDVFSLKIYPRLATTPSTRGTRLHASLLKTVHWTVFLTSLTLSGFESHLVV